MKSNESSWSVGVAILAFAGGVLLSPPVALAQGAKICETNPAIRDTGWRPEWVAALSRTFTSPHCSSFFRVMTLLANRPKAGGRDLTAPKPLDRQGAAGDLQRLRNDPEYLQAYAQASAGETDPIRLQVIQAATLDDLGEFRARDLVIDQLVQGR